MGTLDEKPFRSEKEAREEPETVFIRMGHPRVRPHVVPITREGESAKSDFVTSFLVAWEPNPTLPPHWVELLRAAPFGTQAIRARDLRWDGRSFSIELVDEGAIEAYAAEIEDWVAFANAEFGRREHTPAEEALDRARRRAESLENRLRH